MPLFGGLFGVWGGASVQAVADVLSVIIAIPIAIKAMREINGMIAAGYVSGAAPKGDTEQATAQL